MILKSSRFQEQVPAHSFSTIQRMADGALHKCFLYYNNKNNGMLSSIPKIKTEVYKKSSARKSILKMAVRQRLYLMFLYRFDNCIIDLLQHIILQNIEDLTLLQQSTKILLFSIRFRRHIPAENTWQGLSIYQIP